MHGHNGTLVVVDREPGGSREGVEDPLQCSGAVRVCAEDNQRIICILQHRAWKVVISRMPYLIVCLNNLLENISNDQEQIRGERVALPHPTFAAEPWPGVPLTSTADLEVERMLAIQRHH